MIKIAHVRESEGLQLPQEVTTVAMEAVTSTGCGIRRK
jgi:hypothetical protein